MSMAMEDGSRQRRITVEEFRRMGDEGLLDSDTPDVRFELIDGAITEMPRRERSHFAVVDMLSQRLTLAIAGRAITRTQGPLVLSDVDLFLPDVALLKQRADWYRTRDASGPDTFLVIEVSDTSLRKDLNEKMPYYARHAVQELWIADVQRETMHFFRGRTDKAYTDVSSVVRPSVVTLPTLGDAIDLTGLFGPD